MGQKSVFFVTCGVDEPDRDPEQTRSDLRAIEALRKLLPVEPSEVICGTGTRHRSIPGLKISRLSMLAGTADSAQTEGSWADLEHCIDRAFIRRFLQSLSHDAIVCCDTALVCIICREIDKFPGKIKPATCYKLTVDNGGHIDICELTNGQPAI